MNHAARVVEHVTQILKDSRYAKLISNHIMNDVPYEEFDDVFDALDDAGFVWIWQFQILTVYRIGHE